MMNNRRSGSVGISDLFLVTPCHPDEQRRPEQHGGRGPTLTEGGVVAGAIFFWSYALDWIVFRFPRLRWLVKSTPQTVVEDGRIVYAGLKRELVKKGDLMAQLRKQGINGIGTVQQACVEANGSLSVIKREKQT
jgi:uncharacterized membrane protein YcaP (DUF421 family)